MVRFVLWLLVAASALAAPTKIACIGDSITQGYNLNNPALESYPGRIQQLLGTNNFLVRNFGVGGRTLLKQGDFPYWNETAFADSRAFNPDIVVIQLGTNDAKPYNWRYGTNFVRDYKAMIAIYAALPSAPQIYLCTPCPVFGAGAYDISPDVVRTNIAPTVRELAGELLLPLIDLNSRMTNALWFPDTVHPDSKGAATMAAVIFEALTGGIPETPAPSVAMKWISQTKVVVTWPALWGALTSQARTSLFPVGSTWTVLDGVPFRDGDLLRQTNSVSSVTQRYFRLARP
jgi:acyl-CoA thioesterase-1